MELARVILRVSVGLVMVGSLWAGPPEGGKWVALEAMTDEFNGDKLDWEKWWNRNPHWVGRAPVYFHSDCVSVGEGKLQLRAFDSEESKKRGLKKGFTHLSGYVRSKVPVRFGYFEIRAKLMDASLVSCFWLSNHQKEEWSEIDCMEIAAGVEKFSRRITPNTHYFHGPHFTGTHEKHLADPSTHELGFRTADDFHVYGVEWDKDHIRWFVDGKLIRERENKMFYQPLYMSINVEANSWFGALPSDATLPNVYEVDWVRTWQRGE